jgi:uncharacterized protein (TIGR03435 family)
VSNRDAIAIRAGHRLAHPRHWCAGGIGERNLAVVLQNVLNRRVIDRTGLTGDFDVELFWDADESNEKLPSLLTAVQDQLGLRLQPAKAAIEVLVIDHIERPTPD